MGACVLGREAVEWDYTKDEKGGLTDCRTGPWKGWYVNMSGAKKHPQMEPVTVRFTPEAMRSIEQAAREHGMSKAQVVRLATDGDLVDHLRNVRIVSPDDAAAIRTGLKELCREARKASYEINKIGVNVNQITKAVNYAAKNGYPLPDELLYIFHIEADIMDALVRYEKASEKVGEALCRILG